MRTLNFKIMFTIFAKYGTDEKIVIHCFPAQHRKILEKLNKHFGGNWLAVDELRTENEIIKFNDGLIYKGFQSNIERYSDSIRKVNLDL